jgi:hypothetical protein
MIFSMERFLQQQAKMTDTPHCVFCEGVVVGGRTQRPASWSGFFVSGRNGVKREKDEVMHKKI